MKFTKKLTIDNQSLEARLAHQPRLEYEDWFLDQLQLGVIGADWLPCRFINNINGVPCIFEILTVDQAQADSYIKMASALGEKIGYPLNIIAVVDVDCTEDQLPSGFLYGHSSILNILI